MGILFKTFLIIVSTIILGFLIISSFIIEEYSPSEKNSMLLDNLETDISTLTGGIKYKRFTYLDEVFYSTGELVEKKEGNIVNIDLSPGEYIFSLSGIGPEYIINYRGFSVKNVGPGIFYINTLKNRKYSLFSFSALLNLELRDVSDNSVATNIYIYPHGYMLLDPERNDDLKGGDALKVLQFQSSMLASTKNGKFYRDLGYMIENLGYFNDNILDISGEFNDSFTKKILNITDDNKFLLNVLSIFYKNNKNLYENISQIRLLNNSIISGEKYLDEYSWMFFNLEKKNSFFRVKIFNDLKTLFSTKEKNMKLVDKIVKNIKKVNGNKDKKIQRVLNNYYKYIGIEGNRNTKFNFYSLYRKISNNKVKFLPSLFYLKDIYFNYDFAGGEKLYSGISLFNNQYFHDLGISTGTNNLIIKEENFTVLDYFSNFLQTLLIEHESFDKETVLRLISIFDNYVLLDNNLYGGQPNEIIAIGLKNHFKVLESTAKAMEMYFFEKERDESGLLLKKKIEINSNNIELLEKNINNLLSFFNENKFIYENGEVYEDGSLYIKNYYDIKKELDEYFIALLDYENYKSQNSEIDFKIPINNIDREKLSIEKAISFFMYFENINIVNMLVKVVDNEYYAISNLKIDGREVKFNLYPNEDNTIDEISVGVNKWSGNYELGKKIDDNGNDVPLVNVDYLFLVFSDSPEYDSDEKEVLEKTKIIDKSTNEIAFIRDFLIGEQGDFYDLQGILDLGIDNIIATNNKGWDISLNNAVFNIEDIKEEENKILKYSAMFSSDYIKDIDVSYFENIRLKLIDGQFNYGDDQNKISYLFGGKEIRLVGRIKLVDFKNIVSKLSMAITDIINIGNDINDILYVQEVDISYNISRKKITIKLNYLGDKISFASSNGKIYYIFYKGKNILDSKIELDKLKENLLKLQ